MFYNFCLLHNFSFNCFVVSFVVFYISKCAKHCQQVTSCNCRQVSLAPGLFFFAVEVCRERCFCVVLLKQARPSLKKTSSTRRQTPLHISFSINGVFTNAMCTNAPSYHHRCWLFSSVLITSQMALAPFQSGDHSVHDFQREFKIFTCETTGQLEMRLGPENGTVFTSKQMSFSRVFFDTQSCCCSVANLPYQL